MEFAILLLNYSLIIQLQKRNKLKLKQIVMIFDLGI